MKLFRGTRRFLAEQKRFRDDSRLTLVVGSRMYGECPDRRQEYRNARGLDMSPGGGVDIVHNLESPLPSRLQGLFDHIDCCSVLEHVRMPWVFCDNMAAAAAPGATILIMAPFAWRVHNYPGDYWRYTAQTLEVLLPTVRWTDVRYIVDRHHYAKIAGRRDIGGKKYVQRSEVIGFGVFVS